MLIWRSRIAERAQKFPKKFRRQDFNEIVRQRAISEEKRSVPDIVRLDNKRISSYRGQPFNRSVLLKSDGCLPKHDFEFSLGLQKNLARFNSCSPFASLMHGMEVISRFNHSGDAGSSIRFFEFFGSLFRVPHLRASQTSQNAYLVLEYA